MLVQGGGGGALGARAPSKKKQKNLRILDFNVNTTAKNGIGEHYIPNKN